MSMTDPVIKPMELAPGTFEVRSYGEAAAQVFKKGDLVYYDAAGQLNLCGDAPGAILGVALQDATGVTGAECPVAVINIRTKITASVGTGTVPIEDGVLPAVVGDTRKLYKSAAGKWAVAEATAGAGDFLIVDKAEDVPNNGLVYRAVGYLNAEVLQGEYGGTFITDGESVVRSVCVDVPVASLAAGSKLVDVPAGKKVRVTYAAVQAVGGDATTSTSITITAGQGGTVLFAFTTTSVDQLALEDISNAEIHANALAAQADGVDLYADESGAATAGATSIRFLVNYVLEDA